MYVIYHNIFHSAFQMDYYDIKFLACKFMTAGPILVGEFLSQISLLLDLKLIFIQYYLLTYLLTYLLHWAESFLKS